jgi:hypothetical protein
VPHTNGDLVIGKCTFNKWIRKDFRSAEKITTVASNKPFGTPVGAEWPTFLSVYPTDPKIVREETYNMSSAY